MGNLPVHKVQEYIIDNTEIKMYVSIFQLLLLLKKKYRSTTVIVLHKWKNVLSKVRLLRKMFGSPSSEIYAGAQTRQVGVSVLMWPHMSSSSTLYKCVPPRLLLLRCRAALPFASYPDNDVY